MRRIIAAGLVATFTFVGASHAGAQPVRCDGLRPTILGTPGRDTLEGTARRDVIHGLGGEDLIAGLGGNDVICSGHGGGTIAGGAGDDRVIGGPAFEAVNGGPGDDVIHGKGENNALGGGPGSDALIGGPDGDVLSGGPGGDKLIGGKGDDVFDGGTGSDLLDGEKGGDVVTFATATTGVYVDLGRGLAGRDAVSDIETVAGTRYRDVLRGDARRNVLLGGEGPDRLYGERGNDVMFGADGGDVLSGGPGRDLASYASGRAVTVDLARGRATGQGRDDLAGIEIVEGSDRPDRLLGDDGPNRFLPGGIDNVVDGRGGLDLVSYRGEQIVVTILLPDDRVQLDNSQSDTIRDIEGAIGSDSFSEYVGDAGDNLFISGGGSDTFLDSRGNDVFRGDKFGGGHLNLADSPVPARVDLARGTAEALGRHRLVRIDEVWGSEFNDVIVGNDERNAIDGREGSDTIDGRGGGDRLMGGVDDDTVRGGPGDDDLQGRDGNDLLDGGDGLDLLYDEGGDDEVRGGPGTDVATFGAGDDYLDGGPGVDAVHAPFQSEPPGLEVDLGRGTALGHGIDTVTNFEAVAGAFASDRLDGDGDANFLYGGGGADVVTGGGGPDLLQTLEGNDTLSGGEGDDYLMASLGSDGTDGGPGSDECWHAENVVACEGDQSAHAPQFPPRFESEPGGLRSPRAISFEPSRLGVGGTVADLFGTGCFNGSILIDRWIGGAWERVGTVPLWHSQDNTTSVTYFDFHPLKTPGRYRARLPSVPDSPQIGQGAANCMAAVSEPVRWSPRGT